MEAGSERCSVAGFTYGERKPQAKECMLIAPKAEKSKEADSPLEAPVRNTALLTP